MSQFASTKICVISIGSLFLAANMADIANASTCCNGRTMVSISGNMGASNSFSRDSLATYKPAIIARARQLQTQLATAQGNFDRATDRLAGIQNRQLVATQGKLLYKKNGGDLKLAQAELNLAQTELQTVRRETSKFIQTVKKPTPEMLDIKQPVW
jgi:hypothetical protein